MSKFKLVKVSDQGVSFGNAWFSHEAITGHTAEQLNNGTCKITGRAYMDWLKSRPAFDEAAERAAFECEYARVQPRNSTGRYDDQSVEFQWQGWQRCAKRKAGGDL